MFNSDVRSQGLQGLRAIAAILVVLQHITFYSTNALGIDYKIFLKIDYGLIGVSLFFVISGFVMTNCMNQGNYFLIYRAIRIYPGYWIAILFSFFLLHFTNEWHLDVASFFLISNVDLNNSYKIPYWTLIYEITFYVMIYLFCLSRKLNVSLNFVCCIWLLLILLVNQYYLIPRITSGKLILFSTCNINFIIGFLFSLNIKYLNKIPIHFTLIISIILMGISYHQPPLSYALINAMAYGFLIVYCLNLHNNYLSKLGDYSFGIYLLHVPIAFYIIHLLTKNHPNISLYLLWTLTMFFSLFLSTLFGMIEFHLYKNLKKGVVIFSKMKFENAELRGVS